MKPDRIIAVLALLALLVAPALAIDVTRGVNFPLLGPNGSATSPTYSFSAVTGNGWYWDTAAISWALNGVKAGHVGGSGGTTILIQNDGGILSMGAAADVQLARNGASGSWRVAGGTTPTCPACGTGPTIAGNNSVGSVILGTAPGTPVITFNGTLTSAPRCSLNPEVLTTGTTTVRATSVGTSSFTITSTAALVAADKISWICL